MPIVKRLSRCCKKCGNLYPSTSKNNGFCPKCSKRPLAYYWTLSERGYTRTATQKPPQSKKDKKVRDNA